MTLWVVRAGSHGEQQETALNEGLVCHNWNEMPDCSTFRTRRELQKVYQQINPNENDRQVSSGVGQVWRFARTIEKGDLVALPLRGESAFQLGRVTGDYEYKKIAPNVMHIRRVEWLKKIPRSLLPKDILLSMSVPPTVFSVTRNNAESRVVKILETGELLEDDVPKGPGQIDNGDEGLNLDEVARDEILKHIEASFKGHDLARLIDAVLRAQGYTTEVSPPGPDGGVDILAGSGALGFEQPSLCVQVKSGLASQGQSTFNELLGVVSNFASQQGLLVSWGGFTSPVKKDAKKNFFKIRLWDQGDVVNAILQNYERLDDDIKAELQLKRIWILVKDEDE